MLQNNPTFYLVSVIIAVCLCIAIMIAFILFKLENDKKITQSALEMNRITNSIHAGLVYFVLDDNCSIRYASKGFFELLGYSKNEAIEENTATIMEFVYSRDRDLFIEAIQDVQKEAINFEIRLVKKNGSIIYCLINGNFVVSKSKGQSVSAVFVDITDQKRMQEMLRVDGERYRIASELSNDVLFEYIIDSDMMIYTERYSELFGREPVIPDYVKNSFEVKELIHSDDYGIFMEYGSKLTAGEEFLTAEIRLRDRNKNYIWCQIMGKTIFDEEGRPNRVIGKMANIDHYKRELEALEYKATRDPLTGVYNREVTKRKIEKYIEGNRSGKHLLMFFDFDDFKKINDNYGHLVGDRVLIYVIRRIRSVFREGEIIGRIGGDEFVIFVGYVEEDDIMLKANNLVNALDTSYIDDNYTIPISGSVGVASYPEHGIHYEQLIQCADKALYSVKNTGKNDCMLYNDAI